MTDTFLYVCLDVGQFDVCLAKFVTSVCATTFIQMVQPLCEQQLLIKSEDDYRELDESYERDDVLSSISVKKKN